MVNHHFPMVNHHFPMVNPRFFPSKNAEKKTHPRHDEAIRRDAVHDATVIVTLKVTCSVLGWKDGDEVMDSTYDMYIILYIYTLHMYVCMYVSMICMHMCIYIYIHCKA